MAGATYGEDSGFKAIYESTSKKIFGVIYAGTDSLADAQDIFQETYVDLYNALRSGRKIRDPQSYAVTIARKKLSAHYKRQKKRLNNIEISDIGESEENLLADDYDIEDSVINSRLYEEISARLEAKPEIVRKIFVMFYSLDMSVGEIAEDLSVSQSFVKNKLYRTLKEFRKIYGKEDKQ